jgi:HAD superfamily hydrolase (TIGR01509 family)
VIFDCDGVLVDSEPVYAEAFSLALHAFGCPLSADFLGRSLQGKNLTDCYRWLFEHWQFVVTAEFVQCLFSQTNRLVPLKLRAVTGVHAVLDQITCAKAVASNGVFLSVKDNLSRCDLWRQFGPHVYTSNLVEKPKPAPDIYLYAAQKLGFDPADCYVVEDSLVGVTAALAAGMSVCWLVRGELPSSMPVGVVMATSMVEVGDWLRSQGGMR